ncbi:hypothetical protein [Nocardioides piscis]|uniref:DoxX family protein n=1 Tax=Nocardioides piscis TaxID=2714938 RepID=A0A6G7YD75_9ACTN|nr:hypothetical protein [Nocardioides piscis]QIK74588.1 hypothetical protein G7071_03220 [Nocardioides piscis]
MTMTSDTTRTDVRPRNHTLTAARVVAGLLGINGLAGATYFILIAPEEAVWIGPWVDVPVVALMLAGFVLKLAVAFAPGLPADRRIRLGFLAVALGVAVTLVKIPVYDEPEGVLFLAFDAVLLGVLLLAWRSTRVVVRG